MGPILAIYFDMIMGMQIWRITFPLFLIMFVYIYIHIYISMPDKMIIPYSYSRHFHNTLNRDLLFVLGHSLFNKSGLHAFLSVNGNGTNSLSWIVSRVLIDTKVVSRLVISSCRLHQFRNEQDYKERGVNLSQRQAHRNYRSWYI